MKSQGINCYIDSSGIIKLKNATPSTIQQANIALAKTKYPTSWVHFKGYDVVTSKKFKKAGRQDFASAVSAVVVGKCLDPKGIGIAAAVGFGTYYFVNKDVENVYYNIKHYWRKEGPGKYDSAGNYIGNYKIKRYCITKKKGAKKGQKSTAYRKTTQLIPF